MDQASDIKAKVTILLATRQGERFILQQLESLEQQTLTAWDMYVSDDGSTDRTVDIISQFFTQSRHVVRVMNGPCQGFMRNFMHLIAAVPLAAEYYAFCDQDDLWLPDKLQRAVSWLGEQPKDIPLLYCARTLSIDEQDREIGQSPLFANPPSFSNALVQSIAGGNTMVFNRRLLEIVRKIGTHCEVPSHDWWLYIITTGMGGQVKYDPIPTIGYRQHTHNQVGANSTFHARWKRLKMLKSGRFKAWNDQHVLALETCEKMLEQENRSKFHAFKAMREAHFPLNLYFLLKGGFYRQTLAGKLGLIVGVALRKI